MNFTRAEQQVKQLHTIKYASIFSKSKKIPIHVSPPTYNFLIDLYSKLKKNLQDLYNIYYLAHPQHREELVTNTYERTIETYNQITKILTHNMSIPKISIIPPKPSKMGRYFQITHSKLKSDIKKIRQYLKNMKKLIDEIKIDSNEKES